ncbi:MAG: hypothetical protein Q7T01_02085 [bacterium]|nr:hypothetical protein [bacterium]
MDHARDARNDPHGFVLTLVVLVIATAFVVLAVGASFRTLTQLDISVTAAEGGVAASAIDGCVEEALLQLRRDAAYAGGSTTIGDAACIIVVSGSDGWRTVAVTGTIGSISRAVTVGVAMSPFVLTSWSE